jgi:hypothetical protein
MSAATVLGRPASILAVGVVAMVAVAGCAVDEVMPAPNCTEGNSLLIAAQSVPEALLVPCLERLPDGWAVSSVAIDEDETIVRFDSDRAGDDAAVLRYGSSCDVSAAVSVASDLAMAERFDEIRRLEPGFRAERSYVFPGGCISWTFDFDRGASATQSVAIGDALSVVTRRELNENIRNDFLDAEL